MGRREDLRRIELGLTRIARISAGREAARLRSTRSGVELSRPGAAILATLANHGPMRATDLARRTELDLPLVSRELGGLQRAGHVGRTADPTDGRAGIVALTPAGRTAYDRYRRAVDEIITETFAAWSIGELAALARDLDRVAADFALGPTSARRVTSPGCTS